VANAGGTGTRPNASSGSTSPNTARDNAAHEGDAANRRVTVYDSDGTTTPTGSAATSSPGTWRAADEHASARTSGSPHTDPAPATRGGASMITTIIALIVIVLIAYFVWQLIF
jgi:hypothetical protein